MTLSLLSLADAAGVALGIAYVVLEIRQHIAMWLVGMAMAALYGTLLAQKGLVANATLELYYFLMSFYGILQWRRRRGKAQTVVQTQRLPRTAYPLVVGAIIAIGGAIFLLLRQTTASVSTVVDSLSAALSIVALYLLSRKYLEQWLLWLLADGMYVYLYLHNGLYGRGLLYALYCVLAIVGLRAWQRKYAAEKNGKPSNPK